VVALTAALLAPSPSRGEENGAAAQLQEKHAQQRRLDQEKRQIQQRLAGIQASEEELQSEIERLSDLVRTSRRRKADLERSIALQNEAIAQQTRELERLKREIRDGRRRIVQRMARLYRMLKNGRSAVLFQMARFQSFFKDSRYLALLQQADREAILQYEALNRDVEAKKAVVERNLERLVTLRGELAGETRQLDEREAFLRSSLADVANNKVLYRRYLKNLEGMLARMDTALARLEQEAAGNKPPPAPLEPEALRGRLPAPVQGDLLAGFGEQDPRYDLKKLQRGIVLRVTPAAPVQAVAGGAAVHAGPFRGYQQLVVLDHGRGLFTVYGHLENLAVRRGERVEAGALLGRSAYQPVDEAYNVYFEIRLQGQPDDPLRWLQPGLYRRLAPPGAAPEDASTADN
jgi:septal ring factor EnvC (AmiA/AmiB activator)